MCIQKYIWFVLICNLSDCIERDKCSCCALTCKCLFTTKLCIKIVVIVCIGAVLVSTEEIKILTSHPDLPVIWFCVVITPRLLKCKRALYWTTIFTYVKQSWYRYELYTNGMYMFYSCLSNYVMKYKQGRERMSIKVQRRWFVLHMPL